MTTTDRPFMTGADRLRAEGRAEGRVEAQAAILLRQLTIKFGPLPDTIQSRVRTATSSQLDTWIERILSAATLDEALG